MSENDLKKIKTDFSTNEISNNEMLGSYPIIEDKQQDHKRSPQEQKLLEEIESLKSTREMREKYAEKAYNFAVYTIIIWFCFVFIFFVSITKPISDVVFGIITTACTINILVAFHAVIKGLFSTNNK